MAVKTIATNVERVLASVSAALQTINASHPTIDFYYDGIVVDSGKTVTAALQDLGHEYDQKNVIAIVNPGNRAIATDKRTARARRYTYQYVIWCMATLNPQDKANGVTLVQKQERLVEDMSELLDEDYWIKQAASGLYAGDFNGQAVSCINHRIIDVVSDNANAYPSINFDVICEFDFDRTLKPVVLP